MEGIRCPNCQSWIEYPKGKRQSFRLECPRCGRELAVEIFVPKKRRNKVKVPNFKNGDIVYVVNKESPFYLEPAAVVGRDHMYCRIKVARNRKDILIWVPGDWLQKGF